MTLEELKKVYNSLHELDPDIEKFSWGPTYAFAQKRQTEALQILRKAIKESKNERSN